MTVVALITIVMLAGVVGYLIGYASSEHDKLKPY